MSRFLLGTGEEANGFSLSAAADAFFDESGYTGDDLLNPDQPAFVLAATTLSDKEAAALLSEHFSAGATRRPDLSRWLPQNGIGAQLSLWLEAPTIAQSVQPEKIGSLRRSL